MKFVKIMIIASAFYLTYAHAREIHQAVDEPAAPYNLRWGMSYDEARNTPLYSLEVSDINYAGKDPDLIISTLTPQEVGALKYQEMKLYFDKNKGLKSVFVSADVDSSQQAYKVDDGREALALYNEEVKVLDREYGPATIKEEFIAEKGKFYQSLSACIAKQQEWYNNLKDLTVRMYKIFFRIIAMVIMVMILSDCRQSYYIARNTGRNIMTLSDHQRAKSALNANDLNAAQCYLTGEKYNNRYRPVSGEESWGSLQYRAAKIVANAAANGQKVRDDALYLAYISLFEAEEGVPEHPDIMLGYMHKAMALLLANPQLLDKIDSKNVSTLPSQFTLERYAVWQYLYDGGEIDWTKKAPEGEGYTIAGESYQTWNIKLKKAIWNRGDAFLTNIGKQQFIHDAIDYSQFPVIACTARRKGWHLTLPADYREQNFRGGGRFDWASCRAVE